MILFLLSVTFAALWATTESFISLQSRTKLRTLRAEFFDRIEIENWATFDSISLNLTAKPIFIAITGETGAGKSMFVKALEFCAGKKKSKALHPFESGTESKDIRIKLLTKNDDRGSGSTAGVVFTRLVSLSPKKSFVEIAGKKSTAKDMQSEVSSRIRFWPDDEQSADKYLRYIDRLVQRRDKNIHTSVGTAYIDWKVAKTELDRLKRIKTKMDNGNEFELISFYKEEYDSFSQKLQTLVVDIQRLFSDLLDSSLFAAADNESSELKSLLQLIDSLAPKRISKKLTAISSSYLHDMKVVLESTQNILSSLFAIVMAPTSSNSGGSVRQSRLQKIMRDLDSYSRDLQVPTDVRK